jgi:two-component system, NtrC family, C4-dicarboxylate transport sensor histidine kinase DctB
MLKNYDNDQINSLAFTGSLLKGTAHNINTPLSSILGRADIVRLRLDRLLASVNDQAALLELDKFRRDITLIIDNCNRVSALVKNTVHRCNTSMQNTVQPVNIAGVLREDLEFLMSDMEFKHNIEKIFRIDTAMPTIVGAPVHFSNSFTEIIDNAQAAMRDNETKILTVTAQADGNSIVVSIGDNGCGMDEQMRLSMIQTLQNPVQACDRPLRGLAYVAVLLQPYKPSYQVESIPGNTTVSVVFPLQDQART